MLAKIVGIFPVPGTGLIWDSGTIEFAFDPQWSDGNARSINPVRGILHPTLKNKFVAPSSLGDLFVPATPTGVGVVAGPPVTMRWEMFSSDGQRYRGEVSFQSLLANASNEWNVNSQAVSPDFVTSAGPDPVGLTVGAGDARYVLQTQAASAAQVGVVSLATNAEAITGTNATKAVTPAALTAALTADTIVGTPNIGYAFGVGNTGNVTQIGNAKIAEGANYAIFDHQITFNAGATGLTAYNIVNIPSGYILANVVWHSETPSVELPAQSNAGAVNQIGITRSNVSVATNIRARAVYMRV